MPKLIAQLGQAYRQFGFVNRVEFTLCLEQLAVFQCLPAASGGLGGIDDDAVGM
ncbi:hypothetical protein SDC9_188881 [bioreactor metagenome]|uniref:Uncharacterized protein n=1 Tax=bioreactor metagenome TaxID=1076179 RepID=A0A645HQK5_9ZZZZ